MNKATTRWIQENCHGKVVTLSGGLRNLDPIQKKILANLREIDALRFFKIKPNTILTSSEVAGYHNTPITKPNHRSAIGVWIELDFRFKVLEFAEINSTVKGYGYRMVHAALTSLPGDWQATVVFDQSDGFWDGIKARYKKIEWFEI